MNAIVYVDVKMSIADSFVVYDIPKIGPPGYILDFITKEKIAQELGVREESIDSFSFYDIEFIEEGEEEL